MADGLREVLGKYGLSDDAMAEIEEAATPDTFRSQLAELGAKAKKADDLEAELTSIKSAPKRQEAYQRVGLKTDLPKYARDWLDQNIPLDKLDDLEFIASKVKEGGYEVDLSQQQPGEKSPAERINEGIAGMGATPPAPEGYEAAVQAANTPEELDNVYRRFNKPVPQR